MMIELPILLAGLPLLLIGSLAALRPWSHRWPWLRWAVGAGVIVWFLVVLQGPALLFAKTTTRGTGSVDGLPGQQMAWSGGVTCSWGRETGLGVVAAVRGTALSRSALATSLNPEAVEKADVNRTAYEVRVDIKGDQVELNLWDDQFGVPLTGETVEVADEGDRGRIVTEPRSILNVDDPPSTMTLT
jgi:hypothetical protein